MPERPVSYPPDRHFLRDLDITTDHVAADRSIATAPIDEFVRNAAGAASLGFLAAVVDVSAATVALIAGHPNWCATSDLSLTATGWLLDGPVSVDSRLIRVGSNTVVVGADVLDGHGVRAAHGLVAFARIPRAASASASDFDPLTLVGQTRRSTPGIAPAPIPMMDRIGLKVLDAEHGAVEVHKDDYVINSFGTINGGVLGVLFQAAAESAVPGLVATDLQIHYLRQAGSGPARTATTVLRRRADHAVCSIEAVDAGAGDRVLSLATVTLQLPPT
jgi:acyl-coenzyme A thioesterase PaaI-like protein